MKITKLRIKNLFGIKEFSANGKSLELIGVNAIGKSSIINAIRYALTNRSDCEYIIHENNEEGYVYIETDSGISVGRAKRTNKADKISVKDNGVAITRTTESFLREIFTPLQLNPVEFISMDSKQQNRIILDMIDFEWSIEWIKEQFGEIVPEVNYEQNILRVLGQIQHRDGYYFQKRESINRDTRNKKAFIEEIGASLPEAYSADAWRNKDLSTSYTRLEQVRENNRNIEKAVAYVDSVADKTRSFEAKKQITINSAEKKTTADRTRAEQSIIKLQEQIKSLKKDIENVEVVKLHEIELASKQYDADVSEYQATLRRIEPISKQQIIDVTDLEASAKNIETMKSYINEYDRMVDLQQEVESLIEDSKDLTEKIELARTLPGEILEKCQIPIDGLTIVEGVPRINGLPISNLSDGEKLNLCIDVAKKYKNALNLLLIDGTEKLSDINRAVLYKKCKQSGVQFIAARTTNDDVLTVVEL